MKAHRRQPARLAARAEQGLYRAILSLRSEAECAAVLQRSVHARRDRGAGRPLGRRRLPAGRPALPPDSRAHGRVGHDDRPRGALPDRRQRRLSDRAQAARAALETEIAAMRMTTDSRIKIAVQKSGRLTDHSLELLVRCGLSYSRGKDQLICYGENMPVDVLLVRDDDIPRLVQEDICDLGIVGPQHHRGAAPRARAAGRDRAVQRNRQARLRPVPAVVRSAGRRAFRRAEAACKASASRRRTRASSRTI